MTQYFIDIDCLKQKIDYEVHCFNIWVYYRFSDSGS